MHAKRRFSWRRASRARRCGDPGLRLLLVALVALPAAARADLGDDVALALAHALNGMQGNEIQTEMAGNVLGVDFVIGLTGFSFCLPPDPAAEPDPAPVPPDNAYGCRNAAQVVVDLLPGDVAGEATVQADTLFVDLATTRDRSFYCGEIGSGTVQGTGYALSSCTIVAGLELYEEGGCQQMRLAGVTVERGPIDWTFTDDCLDMWTILIQMVESMLDGQLADFFTQVLEPVVAVANQELCTMTPGAEASWGGMKASYR